MNTTAQRPATPLTGITDPQQPDRFDFEGLKAERQRMYAARASNARVAKYTPAGYSGAELRPYEGRPGSLDFLKYPSLMGGTRVYRRDAA